MVAAYLQSSAVSPYVYQPRDIPLRSGRKEAALSFEFLRCWFAGHRPDARYTRVDRGEFISNCARCEKLIVKPPRHRWVGHPTRAT